MPRGQSYRDEALLANETDRWNGTDQGSISAFAINASDGSLTKLNTVPSGGAGPTYVSLHPSQRFLLVANYFRWLGFVLPVRTDGRLGEPVCVVEDQGEIGPTVATNAPRGSYAFSGHDRTHAHMRFNQIPAENMLHVDLALDKIYVWDFDGIFSVSSQSQQGSVSLPST